MAVSVRTTTRPELLMINKTLGKFERPPLQVSVAKLYLSGPNSNAQWFDTGAWGAVTLTVDRKDANRPHRIKLLDLGNQRVLMCQELYIGMQYRTPQPDFHAFEIQDWIIGLQFHDAEEARYFSAAVNGRLAKISEAAAHRRNTCKDNAHYKSKSIFGWGVGGKVKRFLGLKPKKAPRAVVVGRPTEFRHVTHIGYDPDGGFDVENIPEAWKRLFKEAKISKKLLKNKEAAKVVFQTIQRQASEELQRSSETGTTCDEKRHERTLHVDNVTDRATTRTARAPTLPVRPQTHRAGEQPRAPPPPRPAHRRGQSPEPRTKIENAPLQAKKSALKPPDKPTCPPPRAMTPPAPKGVAPPPPPPPSIAPPTFDIANVSHATATQTVAPPPPPRPTSLTPPIPAAIGSPARNRVNVPRSRAVKAPPPQTRSLQEQILAAKLVLFAAVAARTSRSNKGPLSHNFITSS